MPESNTPMPDLSSLLQNEDTLKALKQMAGGMGLGDQLENALKNLSDSSPAQTSIPSSEPAGAFSESSISPEMIKTISAFAQTMQKQTPEYLFLKSLKPLLRPEKGPKIDQAMQMMRLMNAMDALEKSGKSFGGLNLLFPDTSKGS